MTKSAQSSSSNKNTNQKADSQQKTLFQCWKSSSDLKESNFLKTNINFLVTDTNLNFFKKRFI